MENVNLMAIFHEDELNSGKKLSRKFYLDERELKKDLGEVINFGLGDGYVVALINLEKKFISYKYSILRDDFVCDFIKKKSI